MVADSQQRIGQLTEEELRTANPLIVFLRSLLPWVQAGRQSNGAPAQERNDPDDSDRE